MLGIQAICLGVPLLLKRAHHHNSIIEILLFLLSGSCNIMQSMCISTLFKDASLGMSLGTLIQLAPCLLSSLFKGIWRYLLYIFPLVNLFDQYDLDNKSVFPSMLFFIATIPMWLYIYLRYEAKKTV